MDLSKVTDTSFYFCNNEKLTSLNMPKPLNLNKVKDIGRMFTDCLTLDKVEFNNFSTETNELINGNGAFWGCSKLTQITGLQYLQRFVDMDGMFYNCFSLTSIPFEIDMTNCNTCDNMFTGCPATNIILKNVPSSLDLSKIGTTNYTVINYI